MAAACAIGLAAPRGALARANACDKVDARGLVVSPGSIDLQAHSWNVLLFADGRVIGKDKAEGPTAGSETADPLEFRARVLVHIPDQGHVTTRTCGWYANRPRGMRRQAELTPANAPPAIVPAPRVAPTEATRR